MSNSFEQNESPTPLNEKADKLWVQEEAKEFKLLKTKYPCHAMTTSSTVNWRGSIFPCCCLGNRKLPLSEEHGMCLGNASKTTIADAWRSDTLNKIKLKEMANLQSPCDTCMVFRQAGEDLLYSIQKCMDDLYYLPEGGEV